MAGRSDGSRLLQLQPSSHPHARPTPLALLHEASRITSVVAAQVEPNFTNLVMAIVVLEGLGRQLDPSLDLFSIALELMPTLLLG